MLSKSMLVHYILRKTLYSSCIPWYNFLEIETFLRLYK